MFGFYFELVLLWNFKRRLPGEMFFGSMSGFRTNPLFKRIYAPGMVNLGSTKKIHVTFMAKTKVYTISLTLSSAEFDAPWGGKLPLQRFVSFGFSFLPCFVLYFFGHTVGFAHFVSKFLRPAFSV